MTDLGATVFLTSSGPPSGWGTRKIPPLELAALCDIPILVSDSLSKSTNLAIIKGFCTSALAKVLFAGANALLTTLFQGGGSKILGMDNTYDPGLLRPASNMDLGLAILLTQEEREEVGD
jgi:hypothetical protein